MNVILLINSENPEQMEIAEENGKRLIFKSHEEADTWCSKNAETNKSYMNWDGER